jgi:mevalonate pyrophosphate decarboxylase
MIEVQKLKELQISTNGSCLQTEKEEFKKIVEVLARKIEIELNNQSRVGNINEAAYLSSSKPVAAAATKTQMVQTPAPVTIAPAIDKKYDWYQN